MPEYYSLGLDFGTESARALLVNIATGEEMALAVEAYEHGVIDRKLPESNVELEADWALQHPLDYLTAIERLVPVVLTKSGVTPEQIVGIGIDFTSCTVLPTTADGTALCTLEEYRTRPHAWTKLWKHHAAQPEADAITACAKERGEEWLARYGGKVSSEWLHSKALQILNEDPDIFFAAERFIEAGDWVAWQLTGREVRNACTAGYKALWNRESGYPSDAFLGNLHPEFASLNEKLRAPILAPGRRSGVLTVAAARRFGLAAGTAVSVATIDAHAAVAGAGVADPQTMVMVLGTSSCHMLLDREEHLVTGISGVVYEGILPELYGYEAGQAGVGDSFDWFVRTVGAGRSAFTELEAAASALAIGESGLIALDWMNGNRSTLNNADLTGAIFGLTIATTQAEIYRALIESTGFGTRRIVEQFESSGVRIDQFVACGGLAERNKLLLQIYANILGRPIRVARSSQSSALGAAILGAYAATESEPKRPTLTELVSRMAKSADEVWSPVADAVRQYDALYSLYSELYDHYGTRSDLMLRLRALRQ